MKSSLTVKGVTYEIPGITAKFLWLACKTAVPLSFIFGFYGVLYWLLNGNQIVLTSGILLLLTGWGFHSYTAFIFEKYGFSVPQKTGKSILPDR